MTLVLVEVANEAAVQTLRLQQGVRVVGIIADPAAGAYEAVKHLPLAQAAQSTPRKWAGALASADADSLRAHAEQVRNEWERDTQ